MLVGSLPACLTKIGLAEYNLIELYFGQTRQTLD